MSLDGNELLCFSLNVANTVEFTGVRLANSTGSTPAVIRQIDAVPGGQTGFSFYYNRGAVGNLLTSGIVRYSIDQATADVLVPGGQYIISNLNVHVGREGSVIFCGQRLSDAQTVCGRFEAGSTVMNTMNVETANASLIYPFR